jgi:malonate-semialdehyde dehydrogenase (acetylating) / methylmalonate-semialdehyde dehydrogenase
MRRQTLIRGANALSRSSDRVSVRLQTRHLQISAMRLAGATAVKEDYIKHHSQVKKASETHNFLDNQFVKSKTERWIDLHDPATQNVVTRVPESTEEEMKRAVDSAEKAFKTWKNTSLLTRQQIMFRLATLIRENWDRLAASITLEQVSPRHHPTLTSG